MTYKHFCLTFMSTIFCINALADQFSHFAEAHNILDRQQRIWAIRPYPVDLSIFGYVKGEGIYDSRQNFELREGHLLYFPLRKLPDVTGADINARGDFNEYAIQTRFDISGRGPTIGCMESGFVIEAEFFGRTDATIEACDVRFAYLELRSDLWEFQAGQNYHPICFPFESPDTISFNSGIPIAPFALCPQFKVTYHQNNIEFIAAAIGFLGDRPFGLAGGTDKVFRDAMMPDFYLQIRHKQDEDNYVGFGFDVLRIIPRLVTTKNYKEVNPMSSICADLFTRFEYQDYVIYTKSIYAQTGGIFELIGGIGIHSVDPATDKRTYTPLQTFACYAELIKQGKWEPALFIGIAKNLGALRSIIPVIESQVAVFGIGTDIDTVFRIAPRMRWYLDPFIVGIEYEYTRATYGTLDSNGHVQNTTPVANNRFLFATYYVF